jgi:ribbon-helix-helix CopG family protein
MTLRKTTVMVDADDLELIKEAAAREGRPESEYFREAFHIAAMRTRRWGDEWDIPTFDLGGPIREDDIKQAVADAVAQEQAEIDQARQRTPDATT